MKALIIKCHCCEKTNPTLTQKQQIPNDFSVTAHICIMLNFDLIFLLSVRSWSHWQHKKLTQNPFLIHVSEGSWMSVYPTGQEYPVKIFRIRMVISEKPSWSILVEAMACPHFDVRRHDMNQSWLIVNWTDRNKFQRNLNKNTDISFQKYFWNCHLQNGGHCVQESVLKVQFDDDNEMKYGIFFLSSALITQPTFHSWSC